MSTTEEESKTPRPLHCSLLEHTCETASECDLTNEQIPLMEEEHAAKSHHQRILLITIVLFALFAIAEVIGALASNSLSLLGDAACMSVDVLTYISNLWVERVKRGNGGKISDNNKLIVNVIVPSISVIALLGVSGYIVSDSIAVIIDPSSGGDDDDVDVTFMYVFASVNFAVDLFSGFLFYHKRKLVFTEKGYHQDGFRSKSREISRIFLEDLESGIDVEKEDTFTPTFRYISVNGTERDLEVDHERGHGHGHDHVNVNMMSAVVHVGGDTLRTFAIFGAALFSTFTPFPSALCDAWAAVIVTITVIFLVVPLIKEIVNAAYRH